MSKVLSGAILELKRVVHGYRWPTTSSHYPPVRLTQLTRREKGDVPDFVHATT